MNMFKKLGLTVAGAAILSGCATSFNDVDNLWCPPGEEEITLSADALFKFDRSSPQDLLPKGKAELDEVAEKIKARPELINSIELVGHTDRLGPAEYNYRLGLARAETVKAYLQSKGVTQPITATSQGKMQPVTQDCVGDRATPELTACLQPDRRVTIRFNK